MSETRSGGDIRRADQSQGPDGRGKVTVAEAGEAGCSSAGRAMNCWRDVESGRAGQRLALLTELRTCSQQSGRLLLTIVEEKEDYQVSLLVVQDATVY